MKENLILEGNTIYEIDPVCMRMKTHPQQRQAAGGGRMTEAEKEGDRWEGCGCESFCRRSNSCVVLGALVLAGCRVKRRGRNNFCGR